MFRHNRDEVTKIQPNKHRKHPIKRVPELMCLTASPHYQVRMTLHVSSVPLNKGDLAAAGPAWDQAAGRLQRGSRAE